MAARLTLLRRGAWRRVLVAFALGLPVLSAAGLGVGIVQSNRGAIIIGIVAAVLVPAAAMGLYFVREEKLEP